MKMRIPRLCPSGVRGPAVIAGKQSFTAAQASERELGTTRSPRDKRFPSRSTESLLGWCTDLPFLISNSRENPGTRAAQLPPHECRERTSVPGKAAGPQRQGLSLS